ncbi:helix-turn-helix domain-containing protein [Enterobacter asburiae]
MKNNNDILRSNIDYLLERQNESKVSLSDGSGVNRTTIYKILEGKVVRVQENTLRKFADFFGVSFSEIQSVDLREKDRSDNHLSLDGNKNPIAIPVINDTTILSSLNAKIGRMIVSSPVTYYFGEGANIIGVLLTDNIAGYYEKGDLIIIKRHERLNGCNLLALGGDKKLCIIGSGGTLSDSVEIIGTILEERYVGK